MKRIGLLVALASLGIVGCAGPVVVNYAPSSTMSVVGTAKIGDFEYLPAKSGKVKPNQIRNTAMGDVILEKNIDEYFEKALFTESRFVGINVGTTTPIVSGVINEFLIDDLGYSIDWTLDVTYTVSEGNGGKPCYSQNKKLMKKTDKFVNPFGSLNEVMKLNVEEAFKDSAFRACISNKLAAK